MTPMDYGSGFRDASSSTDFSVTPEGSLPTTTSTISADLQSFYKRLKSQKKLWISYLQENKTCFILSGLFLTIHLLLFACRLAFHRLEYKELLSAFSGVSGVVGFTILWLFVPQSPPYFASKVGLPLYKRGKESDDIDRYIKE